MRPRLLDLFCGAGGAATGYHRAGFDVVGVDHLPQPNYPFPFSKDDALELLEAAILDGEIHGFDAVHASPPCQAYSALRVMGNAREHPDLIGPTRELLRATELPYVIENVPQAPLENSVVLCGTSFGLGVEPCAGHHPKTVRLLGRNGRELRRHRLFETNFPLLVSPCWHRRPTIGFYGDHARAARRNDPDASENTQDFPDCDRELLAQEAMDIDWTYEWDELREAIPPAYTEFIGAALLAHLGRPSHGARPTTCPICARRLLWDGNGNGWCPATNHPSGGGYHWPHIQGDGSSLGTPAGKPQEGRV